MKLIWIFIPLIFLNINIIISETCNTTVSTWCRTCISPDGIDCNACNYGYVLNITANSCSTT